MPLEAKNTTVRVEWECDRGPKVTVCFVPTDVMEAHERDNYEVPHVEDYLSNTFGYLVKDWKVVK